MTLKRIAAAAVVLVLSAATPVAAQQDKTPGLRDALLKGDFLTALMILVPLAYKGNDPDAQFILGGLYYKGLGVPQDYAAAAVWLRMAADQGYPMAQKSLGLMYFNGQGVSQDYITAHMWLNLSAARGETDALEHRNMVAARMTPAQIAEAQKLAREWKPISTPR